MAPSAYLDLFEQLEPGVACVGGMAAQVSGAISLKRIADALDRLSTPSGVVALVRELDPLIEDLQQGRR